MEDLRHEHNVARAYKKVFTAQGQACERFPLHVLKLTPVTNNTSTGIGKQKTNKNLYNVTKATFIKKP